MLLSNPSPIAANVTLTYLLPNGKTIPQSIVVPANGRRTINIADVDPRLASADVSTAIVSNMGIGDPRAYQTYILIANPNPFPAEVQVRFLKPGITVTRTYTLNAQSRLNVWANDEAPELGEGTFGADVQVLNYQPIAVEKAMYWNSGLETFAGGTNVTATRLPPP